MTAQGFAGYLTKPIRKATLFRELMRFVSYTQRDAGDRQEKRLTTEAIDFDRLPEVIEILENRYMTLWKQVRKNLFFEDIGEFAGRIRDLGEQYALRIVKTYGDDLGAHVKHFDVERMNSVLDAFPGLTETLKSWYAQRVREDTHGSQK